MAADSPSTDVPDTDVPAAVIDRLRAAGCVFAEDEARLLVDAARTPAELEAMLARRVAGLPLEHVLGWAEFCGQRVGVGPGVFVPRQRTAALVGEAAAVALSFDHPVGVDLCCGSGAIGAALLAAVPGLELYAADIDAAAVDCARGNLPEAQVLHGDLFDALPDALRGRVDVLVANAPYVPSEAVGLMPPEAREHEPLVALDGGVDGLDVLRRVIAGAPEWLSPGGQVLVETSERQAPELAGAVTAAGLRPRVVACDDQATCVVIGTRRIS